MQWFLNLFQVACHYLRDRNWFLEEEVASKFCRINGKEGQKEGRTIKGMLKKGFEGCVYIFEMGIGKIRKEILFKKTA